MDANRGTLRSGDPSLIFPGEIVTLIGASGSGKSTVLRILMTLEDIQGGEVEIDGDPITIGIRADKVNEVTELAAESLEATPRIGLRWDPDFITAIGKRNGAFVAVLDMGRIFGRLMRHSTTAPLVAAE